MRRYRSQYANRESPKPRMLAIREKVNLSQTELAAFLGVHPITLSKWERGLLTPTPLHLGWYDCLERYGQSVNSWDRSVSHHLDNARTLDNTQSIFSAYKLVLGVAAVGEPELGSPRGNVSEGLKAIAGKRRVRSELGAHTKPKPKKSTSRKAAGAIIRRRRA